MRLTPARAGVWSDVPCAEGAPCVSHEPAELNTGSSVDEPGIWAQRGPTGTERVGGEP